jgi:hypothetical protein
MSDHYDPSPDQHDFGRLAMHVSVGSFANFLNPENGVKMAIIGQRLVGS